MKLRHPPNSNDLMLFQNHQGSLCFKREQAAIERRAVVISMPKAGTYLIAQILSEVGMIDLEVHFRSDRFTDYRFLSNKDKLAQALRRLVVMPLALTLSLIQDGQFAVGHIGYDQQIADLLKGFARFIAVRNARDALVSFMRFDERRLRADPLKSPQSRHWIDAPDGPDKMRAFMDVHGPWLIGEFRATISWLQDGRGVVCRFETLMGDHGREMQLSTVQAILFELGLSSSVDAAKVLRTVIGAETHTYSGTRSDVALYWDDQIEDRFLEFGGAVVNRALGYEE